MIDASILQLVDSLIHSVLDSLLESLDKGHPMRDVIPFSRDQMDHAAASTQSTTAAMDVTSSRCRGRVRGQKHM